MKTRMKIWDEEKIITYLSEEGIEFDYLDGRYSLLPEWEFLHLCLRLFFPSKLDEEKSIRIFAEYPSREGIYRMYESLQKSYKEKEIPYLFSVEKVEGLCIILKCRKVKYKRNILHILSILRKGYARKIGIYIPINRLEKFKKFQSTYWKTYEEFKTTK